MPLSERMCSLKVYLLNLNVFESDDDDHVREDVEQEHQLNLLATRIYFPVFGLLLFSIAILLWINSQTRLITISHPTKVQFANIPFDAQCPCSRLSISSGEFTSVHSSFHQVCSSDFVSQRWLKAINTDSNSISYNATDFRSFGIAQFLSLAGLCSLCQGSVTRSITSFNSNPIISPKVLTEKVFRSQIEGAFEQFQLSVPGSLQLQLDIVNEMSRQFLSGLQTNFELQYQTDDAEPYILASSVIYEDVGGFLCDCFGIWDCHALTNIYDSTRGMLLMTIPGLVTGCLPVNAMLDSTLECFYNQTCLHTLISYLPTNQTFTALPLLEQSRFAANTLVKSLVAQLMVEKWTINISYDEYYKQCAPQSCTYSQVERHNLTFILTKLLGLLGGLTLVLGFLIPLIVRFSRQPRNTQPKPKVALHIRLHQYQSQLKKILVELNLFKQNASSDRQARYQRIGTRMYISLLLSSVTVLATYTFLSVTIDHESVLNPTLSKYIELEEEYSTSLSCPCSSISMSYSTFMNVQPQYHQSCSSDLVSYQWIEYSFIRDDDVTYSLWDYRLYAGAQFQTLAVSCSEAKQAITGALEGFLGTPFVSSEVIPRELFEVQTKSLIKNWQFTTTRQLLNIIKLILATTQGNHLTSGHLNIDFRINSTSRKTTMTPQTYGNCSCGIDQSCREMMSIDQFDSINDEFIELMTIPGFFVGCYLIDSFLASTLECFYNRSCMMNIDQHMSMSRGDSFEFSPLDSYLNSSYETIESLLDKLMVNAWLSNVSFTSYYERCAPQTCTYNYERRMDIFLVVTTVIGIFGGLSLALKILLLILLRLMDFLNSGITRLAWLPFIKNVFTWGDERRAIRQLHFVFMTVTLSIVYLVSAFTPRSVNVQIAKPSLSIYEDLLQRFPNSLQCPCSHVSIEYRSFLSITPRFHAVCSSDFVSERWIGYLYGAGDLTERFSPTDFQYSASAQFRLLVSLCRLSQATVNDTILQLLTSDFINADLLSMDSLHERIRLTVSEFEATVPNSFVSTLSLVRETTGANMLLSALSTNWIIETPMNIVHNLKASTKPLIYQGCSCGSSSKCVQASRGMLVGCYALEALLQSTLHCLYEQNCIDPNNTFQAIQYSSSTLSNLSDLNGNVTIESLVNQMMVEEYSSTIIYEQYFNQCAPSSCIYSYTDRSAVIDGITRLIALYGGLMIICRAIAVIIVRLLWHRTTRIIPISA